MCADVSAAQGCARRSRTHARGNLRPRRRGWCRDCGRSPARTDPADAPGYCTTAASSQHRRDRGIILSAGTLARTPRDSTPRASRLAPHVAPHPPSRASFTTGLRPAAPALAASLSRSEQGAHALRFALTRLMLTRSCSAGRPAICAPVVVLVAAADTAGQASRSGRRRASPPRAKTRTQHHCTRSPSLRSDATRRGAQERAASCLSTTSACDTLGAALGAVAGHGPGCTEYCAVFSIEQCICYVRCFRSARYPFMNRVTPCVSGHSF
jgi:hypothetical protein